MILAAFLFVHLIGVVQLLAEEIWTSCAIRGHLEGPGTLTCKFGVNLNVSRTNFAVQRYGLDSHNTQPVDVLIGVWHSGDQVDYYVHDGYAFDGKVSDTIVINMSSITPDYEGRYLCHGIPTDEELVDDCMLKMSDLHPLLSPSISTRSMKRPTQVSVDPDHQASSASGLTVDAVVRGLPIAALTAVVTRPM